MTAQRPEDDLGWTRIVEQLYADEQAEREATTSPDCAGCEGRGWLYTIIYRGYRKDSCWECEGTGLQPWARKKAKP